MSRSLCLMDNAFEFAQQNLGMTGSVASAQEQYLRALVNTAMSELERMGIVLEESVDHAMLIGDWAAELYRGRAMSDRYNTAASRSPMPRNIMWRAQQILFAQKAAINDAAE